MEPTRRNRELLTLVVVGALTAVGFASVYISLQAQISSGSLTYAVFFFALYLAAAGIYGLVTASRPAASPAGLAITAAALVRPDKSILSLEAKSVRKRMKDKAFARAVSRDDILHGAADLGVDLDEHIAFCIEAMKGIAQELGLQGAATDSQ